MVQVGKGETQSSIEEKRRFKKDSRIGRASIVVVVLLFAQLLLGMWTNLFVSFPSKTPSVNPLDSVLVNGPYIVSAHIINGIVIGVLSILTIALSVIARNRRAVFLSCCGFVSILFAGESGIFFALGWYGNNFLSFSMSTGFVFALAIYFVLAAPFIARSLSESWSG